MFTEQEDFKDFWEFLTNNAHGADEWWLASWLETNFEKYNQSESCPQCKSKQKENVDIWSKTGNYMLGTTIKCGKCNHVFSVKDRRDNIRKALESGNVKMKDVKILKTEI